MEINPTNHNSLVQLCSKTDSLHLLLPRLVVQPNLYESRGKAREAGANITSVDITNIKQLEVLLLVLVLMGMVRHERIFFLPRLTIFRTKVTPKSALTKIARQINCKYIKKH